MEGQPLFANLLAGVLERLGAQERAGAASCSQEPAKGLSSGLQRPSPPPERQPMLARALQLRPLPAAVLTGSAHMPAQPEPARPEGEIDAAQAAAQDGLLPLHFPPASPPARQLQQQQHPGEPDAACSLPSANSSRATGAEAAPGEARSLLSAGARAGAGAGANAAGRRAEAQLPHFGSPPMGGGEGLGPSRGGMQGMGGGFVQGGGRAYADSAFQSGQSAGAAAQGSTIQSREGRKGVVEAVQHIGSTEMLRRQGSGQEPGGAVGQQQPCPTPGAGGTCAPGQLGDGGYGAAAAAHLAASGVELAVGSGQGKAQQGPWEAGIAEAEESNEKETGCSGQGQQAATQSAGVAPSAGGDGLQAQHCPRPRSARKQIHPQQLPVPSASSPTPRLRQLLQRIGKPPQPRPPQPAGQAPLSQMVPEEQWRKQVLPGALLSPLASLGQPVAGLSTEEGRGVSARATSASPEQQAQQDPQREGGTQERRQPAEPEAEGGSAARIGQWVQVPGGGWRREFKNRVQDYISVPGGVMEALGLTDSEGALLQGQSPQQQWWVGIYAYRRPDVARPRAGTRGMTYRIQEGWGALRDELGLRIGDAITLHALAQAQRQGAGGIPALALTVERGAEGSAGEEGAREGSAGGRAQEKASQASRGSKRGREEGEGEQIQSRRLRLEESEQPLAGRWARAPSGCAWRILPLHLPLGGRELELPVPVAEALGICGEGLAILRPHLWLSNSGEQLGAKVEVLQGPQESIQLCMLQPQGGLEHLGMLRGGMLWLGPVEEGGSLPFTCAALGLARSRRQAAAAAGKGGGDPSTLHMAPARSGQAPSRHTEAAPSAAQAPKGASTAGGGSGQAQPIAGAGVVVSAARAKHAERASSGAPAKRARHAAAAAAAQVEMQQRNPATSPKPGATPAAAACMPGVKGGGASKDSPAALASRGRRRGRPPKQPQPVLGSGGQYHTTQEAQEASPSAEPFTPPGRSLRPARAAAGSAATSAASPAAAAFDPWRHLWQQQQQQQQGSQHNGSTGLSELQGMVEGGGLEPAQPTAFDPSMLLGMIPAQRSSAHSRLTQTAAAAAAAAGAGGESVQQAAPAIMASAAAGAGAGNKAGVPGEGSIGAQVDPLAMLCELQHALQEAELLPAQLLELEVAWLGMAPAQHLCIYRAIRQAAEGMAAATGAAGPGAAADAQADAAAAAVRQLAVRAVASLEHGGGSGGGGRRGAGLAPAACDPHAMLCTLQEQLEGAELAPGQLTALEAAWLGQRSPAWWESIGRMVGRALAQGPEALQQVVAAVVRSAG